MQFTIHVFSFVEDAKLIIVKELQENIGCQCLNILHRPLECIDKFLKYMISEIKRSNSKMSTNETIAEEVVKLVKLIINNIIKVLKFVLAYIRC